MGKSRPKRTVAHNHTKDSRTCNGGCCESEPPREYKKGGGNPACRVISTREGSVSHIAEPESSDVPPENNIKQGIECRSSYPKVKLHTIRRAVYCATSRILSGCPTSRPRRAAAPDALRLGECCEYGPPQSRLLELYAWSIPLGVGSLSGGRWPDSRQISAPPQEAELREQQQQPQQQQQQREDRQKGQGETGAEEEPKPQCHKSEEGVASYPCEGGKQKSECAGQRLLPPAPDGPGGLRLEPEPEGSPEPHRGGDNRCCALSAADAQSAEEPAQQDQVEIPEFPHLGKNASEPGLPVEEPASQLQPAGCSIGVTSADDGAGRRGVHDRLHAGGGDDGSSGEAEQCQPVAIQSPLEEPVEELAGRGGERRCMADTPASSPTAEGVGKNQQGIQLELQLQQQQQLEVQHLAAWEFLDMPMSSLRSYKKLSKKWAKRIMDGKIQGAESKAGMPEDCIGHGESPQRCGVEGTKAVLEAQLDHAINAGNRESWADLSEDAAADYEVNVGIRDRDRLAECVEKGVSNARSIANRMTGIQSTAMHEELDIFIEWISKQQEVSPEQMIESYYDVMRNIAKKLT